MTGSARARAPPEATTDSAGAFRLDGLWPEPHELEVLRGCETIARHWVGPEGVTDLVLFMD